MLHKQVHIELRISGNRQGHAIGAIDMHQVGPPIYTDPNLALDFLLKYRVADKAGELNLLQCEVPSIEIAGFESEHRSRLRLFEGVKTFG